MYSVRTMYMVCTLCECDLYKMCVSYMWYSVQYGQELYPVYAMCFGYPMFWDTVKTYQISTAVIQAVCVQIYHK